MYIKETANDYLISATALQKHCNISYDSLKKIWQRYGYIEINNERWLNYNSLPAPTRRKVKIDKLQKLQNSTSTSKDVTALKRQIEAELRNYQSFYNLLRDKYTLKTIDCTEIAQKYAVWYWIVNTYDKQHKTNYRKLYTAYNEIFPDHLTQQSFYNFKKSCIDNGIENSVVDKRLLGTAVRRVSDRQYYMIRSLYMDSRKFNSNEIHKKLSAYCMKIDEEPCSRESVFRYIQDFKKDAECSYARDGKEATEARFPTHTTIGALHRLDQVQGDGWVMPLYCLGEDKNGKAKIQRHTIFAMQDAHSRKIIGYSVGESENTSLILEALDNMLRYTEALPGEFVFDKHSAQGTEYFKHFRSETEKRGVVYTVSTQPRVKAILERSFQYLDSIIKMNYTQYLGKGVQSKSIDARRSTEKYVELRKKENLFAPDEIKSIAVSMVNEYNNTPLASLGGISPNAAYERSEQPHAVNITRGEAVALINPESNSYYKVTQGQITIRRGIIKHEFLLPAHLYYLESEKVKIVYEDLDMGIYIEDEKSGLFTEIRPKQKIHSAAVNRTDKDRELLNQMKGRKEGIIKQSSRNNKKAQEELILNSPDMLNFIDTHTVSKDVRRELEENSELMLEAINHGVNPNLLPLQTKKVIEYKENDKKARSPFAPKKHTISKLTDEDINRLTEI